MNQWDMYAYTVFYVNNLRSTPTAAPKSSYAYHDQIHSQVLADTRKRVCCREESLSNEAFEAAFEAVLSTIEGPAAALRADPAR